MVIHNLHVVRMAAFPPKADAPLVVDSNAMLPLSLCFEGLQPVTRRHCHLPQFGGCVQGEQLPPCAPLNPGRQPAGHFPSKQPLGLFAREALNHRNILTPCVNNVKAGICPNLLTARAASPRGRTAAGCWSPRNRSLALCCSSVGPAHRPAFPRGLLTA